MRIAIMSPWNDACGVALHAELIGRAFLELSHDIVVFGAKDERVKGRIPLDVEDEPFVYRNWEMYRYGWRIRDDNELNLYFDEKPLLEENYDAFIIEKPTLSPLGKLLKIFNEIRSKATTIAVMHEGEPIINENFMKLNFDAYTIFDKRFLNILGNILPSDKTFIIPYPCHPIKTGDRKKAREKLDLPLDKKIVLVFGIRIKNLFDILPVLERLSNEYDLLLLIIAKEKENAEAGRRIADKYEWAEFRYGAPPTSVIYDYLHASDAVLFHRGPANYIPVSSAVHQTLGALTPIICPDNNFFETFNKEVLKYRSLTELEERLREVFEHQPVVNEVIRNAKEFVRKHEARKIAEMYLKLIEE